MLINCWIKLLEHLRFSFQLTSKTELKDATNIIFYHIVYNLKKNRALNSLYEFCEEEEKIIDSTFGVSDVRTIRKSFKTYIQRFESKPQRLSIKTSVIKLYSFALA